MNAPKRTVLLTCAAAMLVSGCAAYDSLNAYVEEQRRKEEEARFSVARMACEKYGFRPSTDAYAQCLQAEVNQIKNREAIAAAAEKTSDAAEKAGKKSMTCRNDLMGQVKCTPD
jgi:Tfp pilus assembly protein PilE